MVFSNQICFSICNLDVSFHHRMYFTSKKCRIRIFFFFNVLVQIDVFFYYKSQNSITNPASVFLQLLVLRVF